MKKRCLEKKSKWYGFGRSQAIRDVFKDKIAINTTIKDIDSIKLNMVKKGEGIYSGLYIVSDYNLQQIKEKLLSREFIRYLEILNKCKNGGYFTFSTDDLKKYLIFKMEKANE